MRKCQHCKGPSISPACSIECAVALTRARAVKQEKRYWQQRKQQLKTRSEHIADTQEAFNAYIRARDRHLPCISCGRTNVSQWHAGHYRSTRAAPELRFDEENCHRQCKRCNVDESGNIVQYRLGLVKRIGVDRVEWLEGRHAPKKYMIDDLQMIQREYRRLTRSLLSLSATT